MLLAVLLVALALRLAHWLAVREHPFFAELILDSEDYDRWARAIAAGDWLGSEPFYQAPLYPYLLAAIYALFGQRLDLVYLAQIALAVAGVWALYRCGRRLAGIGLAAAAVAAVYGPLIFYDVQILKESMAVTVVCFLLWVVAGLWQGGPRSDGSGDGGSGGDLGGGCWPACWSASWSCCARTRWWRCCSCCPWRRCCGHRRRGPERQLRRAGLTRRRRAHRQVRDRESRRDC